MLGIKLILQALPLPQFALLVGLDTNISKKALNFWKFSLKFLNFSKICSKFLENFLNFSEISTFSDAFSTVFAFYQENITSRC